MFEAWTKPELLSQWLIPPGWSARTTADLKVGGRYHHEMIVGKTPNHCGTTAEDTSPSPYSEGEVLPHSGEYLEIKPPERLVFTWNSHVAQHSRVTVELIDQGETTEVWLTHELLDTEEKRALHTNGWTSALDNLEQLLAQ